MKKIIALILIWIGCIYYLHDKLTIYNEITTEIKNKSIIIDRLSGKQYYTLHDYQPHYVTKQVYDSFKIGDNYIYYTLTRESKGNIVIVVGITLITIIGIAAIRSLDL